MTISTVSHTRNKQVSGALKSSTNGGQFAHKNSSPSAAALPTAVPLPAGHEHIPDPSPGQTLYDGRPAPATFAQAWTETFAPLVEAETRVGRTLRHDAKHAREHELLSSVDLETADLGVIRETTLRTVDGKDVMDILVSHKESDASRCEHDQDEGYMHGGGWYVEPEYVDPDTCADLSCECHHCTLEHIGEHPAYAGQTTDDKGRLIFSFNIPDGVAQKAAQVFEAFTGMENISKVRRDATGKPWAILSPVGNDKPAEDPEYRALAEEADKAHEEYEKYHGINEDGSLHKYDRSQYATLIASINSALYNVKTYRIPGNSPYATSELEEKIEHLKGEHAAHEQVVEELDAIEKVLGRPVNESVRKGALEVHQHGHDLYHVGVLVGSNRRDEILANRLKARETFLAAASKRQDTWTDLCFRAQTGDGWPDGILNAPTRAEWRELTKTE